MKIIKPLKIAHRGACADNTENTMEAFTASLAVGFDGIELDVRACATGELIVFHDEDLSRLTSLSSPVAATDYTTIDRLRIAGKKIPLLVTVLETLPPTLLMIEIKDQRAAQRIYTLLNATPTKHTIVLTSKRIDILKRIAKEDPAAVYPRGFISNRHAHYPYKYLEGLSISYFISHHWIVNWYSILQAHRHNTAVYVYPIRSKLVERIIKNHGVDGLICDTKL